MIPTPDATPPGPGRVPPEVSMTCSAGLWHWLDTLQIGRALLTQLQQALGPDRPLRANAETEPT